MGAHYNIHIPVAHPAEDFILLLGGAEPGKKLDVYGEALHALADGLEVLPGQDGGGHQNGALLGVRDALEGRPQSHLGFAKAHVTAEKPVHRGLTLHVPLDFLDAPELVLGFVKGEVGLEIPLPLGVLGEGVALGLHPLGIEPDELLGHIPHRGAHPGFGFLPLGAPQAVQPHIGVLPGADVLGDQIQLGHRHIEHVVFGVLHL